ncbi:T9SS type A sorting domain-containing protein [Bergeyella sp. RCAD1439]|uniref:T9SS type A sorting domain-containing protein n=1 Tax=Bergeyella anatis TaxID=3113737 RepID=UPI002E180B10|nr:T9SS type A sorting domain-containing protein [Bergeyella sp. RCAD1439]
MYFQYDASGNQIYRGLDKSYTSTSKEGNAHPIVILSDESDRFWNEIKVHPVPVKDLLTISWTEEIDEMIESVSLYAHNTLYEPIHRKNSPNINRQIQVDMSAYYMGVYLLSFQLKDGTVHTKNIIKQ